MTIVDVDLYSCGTAMCYKVEQSLRDRKKGPLVWACPSDFMVLPTHYSHLDQLRGLRKKRVPPVGLPSTARPDDGLQTPRRSEWQGASLDDEFLLLIGPNLSPEKVLECLDALANSIRRRGLTVAKINRKGEYAPAFERVGSS